MSQVIDSLVLWLKEFITSYTYIMYMIVGLAVLLIIIIAVSRSLTSLRFKGAVSRSAESKIKTILITLALISYGIYIASFLRPDILWLLSIVIAVAIGMLFYVFRSPLENLFAHLVLATSNTIREGDRVVIRVGDESYEGIVLEMNDNFVVLRTEHNALVYIPNNVVLRSIIVRPSMTTLRLRLMVKTMGESIDVNSVIRDIESIVRHSKLVNKASVQVKLLEVQEDRISLLVEADVINPRNVDEAYAEIINALKTAIPHRMRVEIAQE